MLLWRRFPVVLVTLAAANGCVHGQPRNVACAWPTNTNASPGPLWRDALVAEDLAIRYADAHTAPHSGQFRGFDAYERQRDSCMTALFSIVARASGVSTQAVRNSLTTRPLMLDVVVFLSFGALYAFGAYHVVRRVLISFPVIDGKVASITALGMISLPVSAIAVMLGEWYALTAEMTWVGNGHLSYRADRVPWTQHRCALFLAGVLIFAAVAARCYRGSVSGSRETRWTALRRRQ
jgi:hypothetical protein